MKKMNTNSDIIYISSDNEYESFIGRMIPESSLNSNLNSYNADRNFEVFELTPSINKFDQDRRIDHIKNYKGTWYGYIHNTYQLYVNLDEYDLLCNNPITLKIH